MYYLRRKTLLKNTQTLHRYYCYNFPNTQTVIIKSKKKSNQSNLKELDKKLQNIGKSKKESKLCNPKELGKQLQNDEKEFRVNEVNIQMISRNIFEQLFNKNNNVDPKIIRSCQQHLLHHGIDYKNNAFLPDVKLKLPELIGNDIVEHFWNIGEQQAAPYRTLLKELIAMKVPPVPKQWLKTAGWHKYSGNGDPQPVQHPSDDALIFDVEVLMSAGKRPTLACALSTEAWYAWVSEPLANGAEYKYYDHINYHDLIPLEIDCTKSNGAEMEHPRIVVGHNVSFDRTKVKDQYWLNRTGLRFMDTMSMHTCVSGVTSYQRAVLKTKQKNPDPADDTWMDISSLNSLSDVHKLYCGSPVDKESRNIFVEGNMQDVHDNFQKLTTYCAQDVISTLNVLKELLPLFLERFPHPVTMAGMLELGSAYLPVNSNWQQYIESAETVFEDMKLESRQLLSLKADHACRLMIDKNYQNDLWMWDEDWSTQEFKLKKTKILKKASASKLEDKVEENSDINLSETPNKTSNEIKVLNDEYISNIQEEHQVELAKSINTKQLELKFRYLYDIGLLLLPVKRAYLAGYPAWYRKLCTKPNSDPDWIPGANNVTTSMQITPKLLQLTWEGYPLHHLKSEGWGFLVPFSHTRPQTYEPVDGEPQIPLQELIAKCPVIEKRNENEELNDASFHQLSKSVEADMGRRTYYARKKLDEKASENKYHGLGIWCGVELQGCCHFLRLPHKDGPKYKVGNPLAKDFLDMFSQNVLAAQSDDAEKVLNFGRMMSYWRNNRERIMGQQVVWLPQEHLPGHLRDGGKQYGAIIPQVVVSGTLTRRASEPTWMTASNAHKERIGSELRAMVQAPPGYKFVGADVDSQELWIASLLGDSTLGLAGGTALGWAVLAGNKQNNTDLHTLTATASGISRDHAKIINYARIYGAGQNFAERLLKQFNPTMTISEAKSKSAKMFTTTKGRRVYKLKKHYMEGFMDEDLNEKEVEMPSYQAMKLAKMSNKNINEMFERPRWVGGTESEMFNKLEDIADSKSPATAFLEGRLSRALEHNEGRWASTRLNWAVQSAAADFLHLMVVCMRWLAPQSARFCLSFHDEVRYLVPDKDKYEAAMALQITNLFTRAFCSQRVGINDLPLSVAFFSSVEVDQVMRKESNLLCATPSNPHGLEKGYAIPNGESLDILQVLDKCKNV